MLKAAQQQEFLAHGLVSAARLSPRGGKTPDEVNLRRQFPCPSVMQCLGHDRLCRNPGVACFGREHRMLDVHVYPLVGIGIPPLVYKVALAYRSSSDSDVCVARTAEVRTLRLPYPYPPRHKGYCRQRLRFPTICAYTDVTPTRYAYCSAKQLSDQ